MEPPQPPVPSPEIEFARMQPSAAAGLGVLAAGLYAASFFLPACAGIAGYEAFFFAMAFCVTIPMWGANLIFWAGLARLAQGRHAAAAEAGLIALVLAVSECWLFWRDVSAGYFAWVGSMALLAAAGWCGRQEKGPVLPVLGGVGEGARITSRSPQAGRLPHPPGNEHIYRPGDADPSIALRRRTF